MLNAFEIDEHRRGGQMSGAGSLSKGDFRDGIQHADACLENADMQCMGVQDPDGQSLSAQKDPHINKESTKQSAALLEDENRLTYKTNIEEKLRLLEDAVTRHPLHREILYSVLDYCKVERSLDEAETFIATLPEFKTATQNQYRLIKTLEKAQGLECIERDED